MAQSQLSGFVFKDSTAFFCAFLFVPAILVYTKTIRMASKDQFEETVSLRYKTEFWKRGSEFSRAVREKVCDDLTAMRSAEFQEALKLEGQGMKTSSLEGADKLGDILEKREMDQRWKEIAEAAAKKNAASGEPKRFLGLF